MSAFPSSHYRPSPATVLLDARNFLHSIDVDGDRAIFFRTRSELLREAPFVDGRHPIATSATFEMPLSRIAEPAAGRDSAERLLFNCSFCGSTLLARLLDVPGRSLVLKEPRCLTDLAAWRIFAVRDRRPLDALRPALRLARAALRRRFAHGEPVTVKVASQGNALLADLARDPGGVRPLFITISRPAFLRAIFRGGRDRMAYAASLASHLATAEPDGDRLVAEAVRAGRDPLRKAAYLAMLARFLQVGLFQRAARAGGWNRCHVIDLADIEKSPGAAASRAAKVLGLAVEEEAIERNVEALSGRYAKIPAQAFDPAQRRSEDEALTGAHGKVFDDALFWAERTLGPQREVTN